MTQPDPADDAYPEAWRPPHLRRLDAEAQRRAQAQQQQRERDTLASATSGCGGHLGATGLATAPDQYPAEWQSHTSPKGEQK